jgi:threonine/homoserine/homoserine lactone efflux protein
MLSGALLAWACLGFVGSVPIAGPVSLVVIDSTLENRPRKGLSVAVGASIAESLYASVAFWGLARLFGNFPVIIPISRTLGGAVLIVVGLYFALRHPRVATTKRGAATTPERSSFGFFGLLAFEAIPLNGLGTALAGSWANARWHAREIGERNAQGTKASSRQQEQR